MAQILTLNRPLAGLRTRAEQLKLRAAALWHAYPRETVGIGMLALAVAAALAGVAHSTPEVVHGPARPSVAPPAPPQMILRQLAPEQALQVNQQIPIAEGPNPAAKPFVFKGSAATRAQAIECLASAVYYEAGDQGDDGERAVAQVVLNRVRHPAFPASVCGVVYEGSTKPTSCQFTFTCDGSLYRQPDAEGWKRAYNIARAALSGSVFAPVGYATHYHANYVVPYWASTMSKNAVVGAHIFYRWGGGWGEPSAFVKSYAGREPDARALRNAALAAAAANAAERSTNVASALGNIPGVEPLKLAPSMRGDKRVAVRFNQVARGASDKAIHEDYVQKFDASDNLKWALSSETVASNEKPLGTAPAQTSAATGAASGTPQH
jgi:spore germination cell wall hydrolase CwlJ-like protein